MGSVDIQPLSKISAAGKSIIIEVAGLLLAKRLKLDNSVLDEMNYSCHGRTALYTSGYNHTLGYNAHEEFRGSVVLAKCFHVALRNDDSAIVSLLLKYDADSNAESA
ncbi:hypothetical protein QBC33DRAFT_599640 [Phialemonium atrogriseum]|uniref:Uncharacterized protein n=1 Tax=Phialemonium atrogriseum TaxID=1093897 RepID=A0AAJ0FGX3_9PEZI|nr:uncharacterized protein QBC33DRAFT_599640 [Phialemonium atrogriseum]KAK1762793.1 hypothetical protein QBC33DRAFT_599640 [Phialemonium atrogriseum]